MRAVSVEDLKPGMTLARTIINDDMIVVLSENTLQDMKRLKEQSQTLWNLLIKAAKSFRMTMSPF